MADRAINEKMEFKDKIEAVAAPLIRELKKMLAVPPTLAVLNHYQLRIDMVGTDKSNVPDGFIFKWRYVWALGLSNEFVKTTGEDDQEFDALDRLIERIFDVLVRSDPRARSLSRFRKGISSETGVGYQG